MSFKHKILFTVIVILNIVLIFWVMYLFYINKKLAIENSNLKVALSNLNTTKDSFKKPNQGQKNDIIQDFLFPQRIFDDKKFDIDIDFGDKGNFTYSQTFNINGNTTTYNITENGDKIKGDISSNSPQLLEKLEELLKNDGLNVYKSGNSLNFDGNGDTQYIIDKINNLINNKQNENNTKDQSDKDFGSF